MSDWRESADSDREPADEDRVEYGRGWVAHLRGVLDEAKARRAASERGRQ